MALAVARVPAPSPCQGLRSDRGGALTLDHRGGACATPDRSHIARRQQGLNAKFRPAYEVYHQPRDLNRLLSAVATEAPSITYSSLTVRFRFQWKGRASTETNQPRCHSFSTVMGRLTLEPVSLHLPGAEPPEDLVSAVESMAALKQLLAGSPGMRHT